MGYDMTYRYGIRIKKEDVFKALEILDEARADVNWDCYYYPGILNLEGKPNVYTLCIMDLQYADCADDESICIWPSDDHVAYWSHNILLCDCMKYVIFRLKEAGIGVTGYMFTDWDSAEYWYDFWKDGEYMGRFKIEEAGTILIEGIPLHKIRKRE